MRTVLLSLLGLMAAVLVGLRSARTVFARTLTEALEEVRGPAAERLAARGIDLDELRKNAAEVVLIGIKDERRLELWVRRRGENAARLQADYPVLAASGVAGPKLREGDRQVPEGVYRITSLNPNSRFHLSMKIDYPNAFDLARARDEGRTSPGGDIFVHGGAKSVGCLAVGDPAIEELFLLVSEVGLERALILLCPSRPGARFDRSTAEELPVWIADVDHALETELVRLGVR